MIRLRDLAFDALMKLAISDIPRFHNNLILVHDLDMYHSDQMSRIEDRRRLHQRLDAYNPLISFPEKILFETARKQSIKLAQRASLVGPNTSCQPMSKEEWRQAMNVDNKKDFEDLEKRYNEDERYCEQEILGVQFVWRCLHLRKVVPPTKKERAIHYATTVLQFAWRHKDSIVVFLAGRYLSGIKAGLAACGAYSLGKYIFNFCNPPPRPPNPLTGM